MLNFLPISGEHAMMLMYDRVKTWGKNQQIKERERKREADWNEKPHGANTGNNDHTGGLFHGSTDTSKDSLLLNKLLSLGY